MFSLLAPNLLSFSLAHTISAIGQIGRSGGSITKEQVRNLEIPWHGLLPNQPVFSLLSWHTRCSKFAGRDKEMKTLTEWAGANQRVWVKFVVGDGGAGKSRLGAEFAEVLQRKKWSAGLVNLRHEYNFPMHKVGTLLVIDYPEERVDRVKELLNDLTFRTPPSPLRILFLTRQTPEKWDEIVSAANAHNIVDQNYMSLSRLQPGDATTIFNTTASIAVESLPQKASDSGKALITEKAMAEWLKLAPENERALFIMAAAVHSAEDPDREIVEYTGSEVVKALAKRDVERFQRMAEGRGLKDSFCLARILAMAAIAEELSLNDIKTIIADGKVPLGFKAGDDIQGELTTAGLYDGGKVRAPKPDILAAAFAVDVLGRRPEYAPETVWAALQKDIGGGLERIGRLCRDAEIVLGMHACRLSNWLARAVEDNVERSELLEDHFEQQVPLGWVEAAVAVFKTLAQNTEDHELRAGHLNNLSNHLSALGDTPGALTAIGEAAEIRRRLSSANPARFEPVLAMSLNNLSNRLSDTGDAAGALAAIGEAADLYRRLASAHPARFEPNLATSLNNLSVRLSDEGDTVGALAAIREAAEIRRRQSLANPARFEPDLATSLNNLSNHLSNVGDTVGALTAIREAVEIRSRLSSANPARFEPDLARSLSLLGDVLRLVDGRDDAAQAYREAIALIRPYAEKWPGSRHERLLKETERDLRSLEES